MDKVLNYTILKELELAQYNFLHMKSTISE